MSSHVSASPVVLNTGFPSNADRDASAIPVWMNETRSSMSRDEESVTGSSSNHSGGGGNRFCADAQSDAIAGSAGMTEKSSILDGCTDLKKLMNRVVPAHKLYTTRVRPHSRRS